MGKHKTEYRPTTKWPAVILLPCGCELHKEKIDGEITKSEHFPDGHGYTYSIETFCSEHDPSLWENFEGCDGKSYVEG
jgi:hypothetical protein